LIINRGVRVMPPPREPVIFHPDEYEENIFWKSYCDMEQTASTSQSRWTQFLQRLKSSWSLEDPSDEKFAFWDFRMKSSQYAATRVLMVDLITYLCAWLWTLRLMFNSNDRNRNYLRFLSLFRGSVWSLYLAAFAVYFVVFRISHYPAPWAKRLTASYSNPSLDFYHIWQRLQIVTTTSRFVMLVFQICSQLLVITADDKESVKILHNQMCFESHNNPVGIEGGPNYAASSIIDMVELLILSVLPLDWIHVMSLCLIETTKIVYRAMSCLHLISTISRPYSVFVSLIIIYIVAIICCFTSLGLESQLLTCFEQIQIQKKDSTQKQQLVNLLCQDIKLPTQQLLQVFHSMKDIVPSFSGVPVQSYVNGKLVTSMKPDKNSIWLTIFLSLTHLVQKLNLTVKSLMT
jgi:uncharacterized protein YoxC